MEKMGSTGLTGIYITGIGGLEKELKDLHRPYKLLNSKFMSRRSLFYSQLAILAECFHVENVPGIQPRLVESRVTLH